MNTQRNKRSMFLHRIWFSALFGIVFVSEIIFLLAYARSDCLEGQALPRRAHSVHVTDFGAVGDGATLNTAAFQAAIGYLKQFSSQGGSQLIIPPGRWLTGSFNLTSNFTLYLHKNAVILGSQRIEDWPVIDPLPSYGRGRERPGGRHISLIHGENLSNVVITGENGTIDGQGSVWWEMWYNRSLEHTRGHLVELISSETIIISNVVLRNSPFWNIHPVYCDNVIVKNVSIFAPSSSPNTDGIDPDSSSHVCIEDCYISNGDDLISIKSGWDEYGISFARPSTDIIIRRVSGTTPFSGFSIGSEMSGGVKGVHIRDVHVFHTGTGLRIKTAPGRGGYVQNITVSGMLMTNVKKAIDITADAGEHPDGNYNPSAMPLVSGIYIDNVVGQDVASAGRFLGLQESPLLGICLSNISLNLSVPSTWSCSYVEGAAAAVSPPVCSVLMGSEDHFCGNMKIQNSIF